MGGLKAAHLINVQLFRQELKKIRIDLNYIGTVFSLRVVTRS